MDRTLKRDRAEYKDKDEDKEKDSPMVTTTTTTDNKLSTITIEDQVWEKVRKIEADKRQDHLIDLTGLSSDTALTTGFPGANFFSNLSFFKSSPTSPSPSSSTATATAAAAPKLTIFPETPPPSSSPTASGAGTGAGTGANNGSSLTSTKSYSYLDKHGG